MSMRLPSTTRHVLAGILTFAIAIAAYADDAPRAPAPEADDLDIQDLIYLAPRSPVFVRLRIKIDGVGLRALRDQFADELFKSLDADKDGKLSAEEAQRLPAPALLAPASDGNQTAAPVEAIAANTDDDPSLSREEVIRYVRRAGGAPFFVSTQIQNQGQTQVELFERLDRNRDGVLDQDDLDRAAERLAKMDANGDGRIQADEIEPQINVFAQPNDQSAAERVTATLGLLEVVNRAHIEPRLIRKLIQLYDKLGRDPKTRRFVKDQKLSSDEIGMAPDVLSRFDANGDKALDAAELATWLSDPEPQFEVLVDWHKAGQGTTFTMRTRPAEGQAPSEVDMRVRPDGALQLVLAGALFDLTRPDARANFAPNYVEQYSQQFAASDNDQNGYLDRNEFNFVGGAANYFPRVDADGNGMIFKPELIAFIEQQTLLAKSRMTLAVTNNTKSLFDELDTRSDRQFDDAELAALADRIRAKDRNGDGVIEKDELPEDFRMLFDVGNSGPFGQVAVARVGSAMAARSTGGSSAGWFVKMDRNQDGRLSRREFLGPLAKFAELDQDGDGYLSGKEAEAAK